MRTLVLLALGLAGCAASGTDGVQATTISGVTSQGAPISGSNIVDAATGEGRFSVATADDALRCTGRYDAVPLREVLIIPVTCSDGRTGEVTVERDETFLSGRAIAQLTDGTQAFAVFGDADFDTSFTDTADADDI